MRKGKMGKREKTAGVVGWKTPVLVVLCSIGTTMLLLGVCAVLIGAGVIPERAGEGSVLLSCAFGCAAGGRVMVRDKGTGTLLWGLAAGGMTAVVFGVFGSLLYGALDSGLCAAIGGACLCGGGLAGVLGGRKRKR